MKTALTVAGSDSVGGAGIQADVKAMAALGVHAATVITAVTAQNTREVSDIHPIPEEIIKAQLEAVLKDCDIQAVKTGMLYCADTVKVVADILEDHNASLIVDPVMIATVGDSLSCDDLKKALKEELLPICELVTPNKYEAEVLSGMEIRNREDAMLACEIIGKGGTSVLLKGGHMDTKSITDYLYLSSEFTTMSKPRLTKAGHGSGCILSSYITANIAKGLDVVNSVLNSRELIQKSIETQYAAGKGELIVNPLTCSGNTETGRFTVLDALDDAAKKLVDKLHSSLIPVNGMNIAYATADAAGPEDVAAIDGRITVKNGRISKNGPAKFGVAGHLSYLIMELMKVDPAMRCAINLCPAGDTMDIMEEIGFNVVDSKRKGNPEWSVVTRNLLARNHSIPDAIYDVDAKNGKTLKVLGRSPSDVLSKLESILN